MTAASPFASFLDGTAGSERPLPQGSRSPHSPAPRQSQTESANARNRATRFGAGTVLLLALSFLAGCTKYPQVEFANLKYVAALRTACSAKNPEWLAQTKSAIDREHTAGTLGDEEHAAYHAIITTAESGDWRAAEEECVRFQKDQLAK